MAGIEELRAGLRDKVVQKSESHAWIIASAAAFAAGLAVVFGWNMIQPLEYFRSSAPKADAPAPISIAASSDRLGRPDAAPILAQCTRMQDFDFGPEIPPNLVYSIMKTGSLGSRILMAAGKSAQGQNHMLMQMWGQLAQCVYQQNTTTLCQADNRALAVEVAVNLVRHAKQAQQSSAGELQDAGVDSTRNRLLSALQSPLRNGVLIASDFGYFPPAEIKKVLSETKTMANACPQKR